MDYVLSFKKDLTTRRAERLDNFFEPAEAAPEFVQHEQHRRPSPRHLASLGRSAKGAGAMEQDDFRFWHYC